MVLFSRPEGRTAAAYGVVVLLDTAGARGVRVLYGTG